jgi:hypothetical protein
MKFDTFDVLFLVGLLISASGAWGKWGASVAGLLVGAVLILTALIGSGVILFGGKVRRGNTDKSGE